MNIFGIGLPEMAVIAAIGLLVFGPKRLPELGKTLGRTLRGFQSASQEFEQEFRSAIATSETSAATAVSEPVGSSPEVLSPVTSSQVTSDTQLEAAAAAPVNAAASSGSEENAPALSAVAVETIQQPAESIG